MGGPPIGDDMIQPLSFQQVNWDAYIQNTMDQLGVSPTRCLDKAGIKLEKPHAYLTTLNSCFIGNTSKHCFFSFIGVASSQILIEYITTDVDIVHKESAEERGMYVYIVSGNLHQWYTTILQMCSSSSSKKFREIGNKILGFFEAAGFKSTWERHTRSVNVDGSYTLKL